jgi:NTP pyrophosphatase (non-canonical NTP hydrolase)
VRGRAISDLSRINQVDRKTFLQFECEEEEEMTFDEYQKLACRTANKDLSSDQMLSMTALGLGGESGEAEDMVKKAVFHGHTLDKEKLTKELGDVLWYLAVMAETIGVPMSEVAEKNVAKLKARYPEGFSAERSINRTDE